MKNDSYSHIGKKKVNEDFLKVSDNCYVVCDGVGGEIKGEIASKEIANYIIDHLAEKKLDQEIILKTIINSQNHLSNLLETNQEYEGMATTLAALFISDNGFYTAHIGDSRVFLIRPSNKTFWQTWDHSLVGGLIKNSEITREEGRNHPMNNQIFKAIKANFKGKISEPEIYKITDLREEDIFFICSDGVFEAFADFELLELLANLDLTITEKLDSIKKQCANDSFDNNTAIILQLEKKDIPATTVVPLSWTKIDSIDPELSDTNNSDPTNSEDKKKSKRWFDFLGGE